MPKVLLVIPPDYDHNFPPLATPVLAAYLKDHGVEVFQEDLNIGYRNFLLDHIGPALTAAQKKVFLPPLSKKFFLKNLRGRYYSKCLKRTHESGLPLLPYDNNSNSSFAFTERLLNSPYWKRYLADKKENTFLQFYLARGICERLKRDKIGLLGLSVISPSQAIASLTLGLMVKNTLPHIHVVFGGPWVTLYRHELWRRKKDFFWCFDSFIPFEGEAPLLNLVRALEHKDEAPLLQVIRADTPSDALDRCAESDLNTLPCPDFDGLPLEEYDEHNAFGTALTYETSRGCYWSRCAYCVDLPLPKPSYRAKSAVQVARDIRQLQKKYKARTLMLGDPGVSPRQMLEVSDEIIRSGIDIGWWCMARLDDGFRLSIFQKARMAGLWQMNFGFESASDRVCDFLNKGNRRERSSRVIKDAHAAGIQIDLQTMIALPGETWEEGLETVSFLKAHKPYLAHVTFNTYYLTPANHVFEDPEKYGLSVDKKKILPFGFFLPFKNRHGLSPKEGYLLQKLHHALSEKVPSDATVFNLDIDRALAFEDGVVEGRAVLCLNSEASALSFLSHPKKGGLLLFDSAQRGVLSRIRRGALIRDVHRAYVRKFGPEADFWIVFMAEALEKGFLKYA